MKGKLFVMTACVVALCAFQAQASVFSGSGGSSLQSLFNSLGYDYIDVADYQTDLNFKLQGMMEFQLLNRSAVGDNLSFGVLEGRHTWWGTYYRHQKMFDARDRVGSTAMMRMDGKNSTYGFYISKPDRRRWWRTTRYYSYSPFNVFGSRQALFYRDPMNSNSYLLAWEGMYVGSSHSDASYDDLVVRLTVHGAPEPATWVLLGTGLIGLGVFVTARRKRSAI